jgi:hypothetical protein
LDQWHNRLAFHVTEKDLHAARWESGTMQNPEPQEINISSAEHQPFLELQAVDLSFHLAVTPF